MSINLIPWRQALQRQRCYQFYAAWIVSIAINIAMLTLLSVNFHHANQHWRIQNNILNRKLITQPFNSKPSLSKPKIQRLLKNIYQIRHNTLPVITAIIQTLPSHCYLTQIQREIKVWTLTGVARQAAPIFTFLQRLQETKIFPHVSLTHIRQQRYVFFTIQLSDTN